MRPLGKVLAATAVAVGLVGALHLPFLLPLLRSAGGGCPLGFGRVLTREELDRSRAIALSADRGDREALGKPALGFVLDRATRTDLAAWADDHHLDCADEGRDLRCRDLSADALPDLGAVDQLLLQFDAHDRLVAVDATLRPADPEVAASVVRSLADRVRDEAGPATATRGEATGAFLARGPLNQAASSFRFLDYRADVSATNLGSGRFVVRATFQSIG